MAKRKSSSGRFEGYDVMPLPPDTYDKPVPWSRPPIERTCARVTCNNVTTNDVLCDDCFYVLLNKMQTEVTQLFEKRTRN